MLYNKMNQLLVHIYPLFWISLSFAAAATAKSLQSCPTRCDPLDCSLPGFSVHGIFQARVREWVASAFSRTAALGPDKQRAKGANVKGEKENWWRAAAS